MGVVDNTNICVIFGESIKNIKKVANLATFFPGGFQFYYIY